MEGEKIGTKFGIIDIELKKTQPGDLRIVGMQFFKSVQKLIL